MQPLRWEYRPDGLRAPALICAFKGWNDAADAASTAITFVGTALGGRRFATKARYLRFCPVQTPLKIVRTAVRLVQRTI